MRKRIAAGNWKMNTSIQEGITLAKEIQSFAETADLTNKLIVLGCPFTHLSSVVNFVDYKKISISAQNCAEWEKGAYTGEVSAEMIKSTGAHYVIIGHSERRQYFKESNDILYNKVNLCLKNTLKPIFCVGELLEERESNNQFEVIKKQLEEGLFKLEPHSFSNVVIAYEPVWAIGTGKTATPEQAQEIHAFIRKLVSERYGISIASETSILYGGSCNAQNANQLFSQLDVDGGLIGGASLKSTDFIEIIKAL